MTVQEIDLPRPIAGYLGMLFGAAALLLVMTHFWAGPFAPRPQPQRASVTIGEFAAEIRKAAKKRLAGAPRQESKVRPWTVDRILKVVAVLLAGLALILGLVGFARKESRRPVVGAVTLGVAAIGFQLFTWVILAVIGTIIIVAILSNMDDILGG